MVEKLIIPKPKIILPHASANDWDFNSSRWQIQTTHYVSPPSALQIGTITALVELHSLCKNAAVLILPQGRIVKWVRLANAQRYVYFNFRNTAPPGTSNNENGYFVTFRLSELTWALVERVNGTNKRVWERPKPAYEANTWYRFRLSWWMSWDLMIVTLERKINEEWVKQGDIISIENPLYGDAQYQRPGVGGQGGAGGNEVYIDDTEIWAYIP